MNAITAHETIMKLVARAALNRLQEDMVIGRVVQQSFDPVIAMNGDKVRMAWSLHVPLVHISATFQMADATKVIANPALLHDHMQPAVTALAEYIDGALKPILENRAPEECFLVTRRLPKLSMYKTGAESEYAEEQGRFGIRIVRAYTPMAPLCQQFTIDVLFGVGAIPAGDMNLRVLLLEALNRYQEAAESWHEFHHGTDIQCDDLCACIPQGRAVLQQLEVIAKDVDDKGFPA